MFVCLFISVQDTVNERNKEKKKKKNVLFCFYIFSLFFDIMTRHSSF